MPTTPTTYLSEIRALLERDQIPAAVNQLKRLLQSSPLLTKVLEQSGRHQAMVKYTIAGVISFEQATETKDDIRRSLLALVDEIEQQQQKPEIKQEFIIAVEMLMASDRRAQTFRLFNRFGLGLLLIVGIVAVFLYVLRDRIWPESLMLTVLVHGPAGKDDLILRDQGEVMLDIGDARYHQPINHEGEATFKAIPGLYIGDTAFLSLDHPQPYKATHPKTSYRLGKGNRLYLEVKLTGLTAYSAMYANTPPSACSTAYV